MTTECPGVDDMAKAQKTTPTRLTEEAIKIARIAAGYSGESVAECVSRLVVTHGTAEIREKSKAFEIVPPPTPPPSAVVAPPPASRAAKGKKGSKKQGND